MIRSKVDDSPNDFDFIVTDEHITNITAEIKNNFMHYFSVLEKHASHDKGIEALSQKFKVTKAKNRNSKQLEMLLFDWIEEYEKEASKYRDFFKDEVLQEYLDHDPNAFKAVLKKECPIIRNCVNSEAEQMKDWKKKFQAKKGGELLDMFINLYAFYEGYVNNYDASYYSNIDHCKDFDFDQIEDKEYKIIGVIGNGIKSTVLYHLRPDIFARLRTFSLFGLYFLTKEKYFSLPSQTSEFIMINDTFELSVLKESNYRMDRNYWYPYGLFTLHAIRLYRLLKRQFAKMGINLSDDYRYMYVDAYLSVISENNVDYINTMTGMDENKQNYYY